MGLANKQEKKKKDGIFELILTQWMGRAHDVPILNIPVSPLLDSSDFFPIAGITVSLYVA